MKFINDTQGSPGPLAVREGQAFVIGHSGFVHHGHHARNQDDPSYPQARAVQGEWFRRFLEMPIEGPNRLKINRLLSLIQPKKICVIFTANMQIIQRMSKDAMCLLDGKRCFSKGDQGPLYMVSAWCNEKSSIMGQVQSDIKSNEITTIPELLALLDIESLIHHY